MGSIDTPLDVPEVDEIDSPFKRRIAVLVAAVALFAGLLGYGAAGASGAEARLSRDAQRDGLKAMIEYNGAYTRLYDGLAGFASAGTLQHQETIADARASLLGMQEYAVAATEWSQAADRLSDLSPLLHERRYDERPDAYGAELLFEPRVATLRQQARLETAVAWGDKVDQYTLGITLLAVALSLLGLSLTVQRQLRRFLVRPALVIVGLCLAGAFPVVLSSPHKTPDEALRAVAQGDRLMGLARFDDAVDAYSASIDADPSYALAYRQRASAHVLRGTEERSAYVIATTGVRARRESITDLELALNHGAVGDYVTHVNQGANYFHIKEYVRSERHTRLALELNDGPPIPWMNLGLVLLAQNSYEDARNAFREASTRIDRRPNWLERRELYAAARGTLETLADQQPHLRNDVRRLQGELVGAQLAGIFPNVKIPKNAATEVSDFRLATQGTTVTAQLSYSDLPVGAPIAWIVYFRSDANQNWQQRQDLSVFEQTSLTPSGDAYFQIADQRCPAAGDYRVDLFVGHEFVANGTTAISESDGRFVDHYDWPTGVSVCRPTAWRVDSQEAGVIAIRDASGEASVTIYALPLPAHVAAANRELVQADVLSRLASSSGPAGEAIFDGVATIGGRDGHQQVFQIDDHLTLLWSSVGDDAKLRTVVVRSPLDSVDAVNQIIERIRFS